jgi:lysophospholipase L1-like esterase
MSARLPPLFTKDSPMPSFNSRNRLVTTIGLALRSSSITFFTMLALTGGSLMSAEIKLEQGAKIVFLGDSITQAGAGPNGYVTIVKQRLAARHAELGAEVIGAGISGNKVPDLEKRLERDVLSKQPTLVVIYIGINDVWHSQQGRGTPKEEFDAGLRRIIQQIRGKGAGVLLCTASVIGEKHDGSNLLDKMLDEYCETSRKVAADLKVPLLDLRQKFLNHLKSHNPDNAEKNVLTTDGVHLNAAGNRFVAEQMLGALGLTDSQDKLLRHIVLFKFKETTSKAEVQEVVDAFHALPGKIPEIADFEYGTDVSVENKAAGFTHGFVVTFKTAKDREIYLPHPAHQEFVKLVGPRIADVLVFDYWTGK